MKKDFITLLLSLLCFSPSMSPLRAQPTVTWDKHSLSLDGQRVCPVMGEIHYSRLPAEEWAREVRKMREGGVTLIATYVFWSHIEEDEGIFNWSGQRNLRHFIEICRDEGMPVVLRIGPWCHGEVRCGGLPDWLFDRQVRVRSEDPVFLRYVTRLYRQIFTQIQGLQWKDGGPVLACQFDNEWGGAASYLLRLKSIANEIGFDLPFYTYTGWPGLKTPLPYGTMLPLYGDYAAGFWDRNTKEHSGNYWQAFHFRAPRTSASIGTDFLDYSQQPDGTPREEQTYPYFTCELGGGMMTSYHRRIYIYPEDALSMAVVKLGSGSNLLGYYMYHGGTNPDGRYSDLNEQQRSPYTTHNDLPHKTYDFQAPLGEFGQRNPHYWMLRPLHLFMADFGALLAPMTAQFPQADRELKAADDSYLRWSYRTDGHSAFVFINNYERLRGLSAKRDAQFEVCGQRFPQRPVTIPASCMAVLPVNLTLGEVQLQYATAQLVAQRDGRIYLMAIDGLPTELKVDGKVMKNVRPGGTAKPVYKNLYLLTRTDAEHLGLTETGPAASPQPVAFCRTAEAGPAREVKMGPSKVAEQPTDADFAQAAVYRITLPSDSLSRQRLMQINYRGDVARLYADGCLLADNFYNGRPMLYGLWRLPAEVRELELRILPLSADMPVYFPREADTTPGEAVMDISLIE